MTPGDFPDEAKTASTNAWLESPFLGGSWEENRPANRKGMHRRQERQRKSELPKNRG
jgi:hypothetical protein